jgi:2,3-bisphosphoglycerate-dependent phosphoglycerate mutase
MDTFAAIYSSDLMRARQTAEPIAKSLGCLCRSSRVCVRSTRANGRVVLVDEIKARYAEVWSQRTVDPANVRPPGGETVGEVAQRVHAALNDIARFHPGGTVLVVSHGLSIATAICRAQNIPVGQAYTVIPDNVQPVWMEWQPDEKHASGLREG